MKLAHSRICLRSAITFFLVLFFAFQAFSQDVTQVGLTWKVNSLYDQSTQQSASYTCSFKSNGPQDILWLQRNGQFTTTLNVLGVNGSWANINSIGTVSYSITSGSESGNIVFERTAEGIFIYLTLSQSGGQPLNYKFSVSEVTLI